MKDLFEYLSARSYPGRGIVVGNYGDESVIAYFIMGRSDNSRNRIFCVDGDRVYTKAYDESKVQDPSLIIYNAVRCLDGRTIVTNGDQTDTVYDFLLEGKTFSEALDTREYEPDGPNWTPRISAMAGPCGCFTMGILKRNGDGCERLYYDYEKENGKGRFLSTYVDNGSPLPSFEGEPVEVAIDMDIDEFAPKLWDSLNFDNKISLYVRYTGKDGFREAVFNKNEG